MDSKHTLQGCLTNPPKWHFEDDFPFPKVGYVNSLEGKCEFKILLEVCCCFFGGESPISRQITEKDEIKIHELRCFQELTYMFFDLFDSESLRNYLQVLMVCILFKGVGKNLPIRCPP